MCRWRTGTRIQITPRTARPRRRSRARHRPEPPQLHPTRRARDRNRKGPAGRSRHRGLRSCDRPPLTHRTVRGVSRRTVRRPKGRLRVPRIAWSIPDRAGRSRRPGGTPLARVRWCTPTPDGIGSLVRTFVGGRQRTARCTRPTPGLWGANCTTAPEVGRLPGCDAGDQTASVCEG